MNQTIAITGATGFIGQTICRRLREAGYDVRALVRTPNKGRHLQEQGVEFVTGDLEDAAALERLVEGAAAVVHCAGAVRGATQQQFDRVNAEGVRRLLRVLESCRPSPRLLSLSSLAAREPQLSFYAASKYRGEQVLITEAEKVDWMVLRPPAVYGPGDKELLPLFRAMARGIAPVPGSLDARFSMIFVDDLAGAVIGWLRSESVPRGIYTLDDGRTGGYTWADVAGIVSQLCQRKVRLLPIPAWILDGAARLNGLGGRLFGYAPMLTPEKLRELRHPDWVCDSKALMEAIDWQPTVQLESGLRQTPGWAGFREGSGGSAANDRR